ncbi:MAG: helix-turn-helix transcriptional regulator, partial [Rhodospirillales bacterium]|nr:helix-turn-helix transcriptional regulator [Rhodospirillales bacterium]
PAVSRYAATTPALLAWFKRYNQAKPYRQQVRPFNFMLAFQAKRPEFNVVLEGQPGSDATTRRPRASKNLPRAVAPYDRNPARAAAHCFDRETGELITRYRLKTVGQSLVRYHLHPDRKVLGGDYCNAGTTQPLRVRAMVIHFIGKEANRWEEQFHLGEAPEAQAEYGTLPNDREQMAAMVREGIRRHGAQVVAERANVSRRHVSAIAAGGRKPSRVALDVLARGVAALNAERRPEAVSAVDILPAIREACERFGIRNLARVAGINDANLSRIIAGTRNASADMIVALMAAIGRLQAVGTAVVAGMP